MISFYLRCSLKRRPLRHIAMWWIMMCAFLLPLIVSVYRDSLSYGIQLQRADSSKDAAYHLSGATEADLEYFRGIEGMAEPIYQDGTIYLAFESDEDWEKYSYGNLDVLNSLSEEAKAEKLQGIRKYSDEIDTRIAQTGHRLTLAAYAYDQWSEENEDPVMDEKMQQILHLNIALLLFSGAIVFSAYRNHLAGFSQELADLRAMGATKGQIFRLFLGELVILFSLAAAGAVGAAWVVMRFLYAHYLGNMAQSVAIWEVFHMDPGNTGLEIGFYFLVCLVALAGSLLLRPRVRKIRANPKSAASLPRLWVQRTKPPIFRCLLILVPLVTAFVILFNQYLSIYAQKVYGTQEATIFLSCADGFTQEELDIVSSVQAIRSMEQERGGNERYFLFTPSGESYSGKAYLYSEYAPNEPPLEKYEIAVDLPEGEDAQGSFYLARIGDAQNRTEVTLGRTIPRETQDFWAVSIYVSDALLQELRQNAPVTKITILTAAGSAASLEQELRSKLPSHILISNFQNGVDTTIARQEGRLWLLSWIFCILMVVAMQIIWVRLAKYVDGCAPMLTVIRQLGGSPRQMGKLIPAWAAAIAAAVLPFAIGIPWAKADAAYHSRPFIVSAPVIAIYGCIALLAMATFLLPVKVSLRKVLKSGK